MELIKELTEFFTNYSTLKADAPTTHRKVINYEELDKFLKIFKAIHQKNIYEGSNINIFEICRIGRNEVKNCSIMAWLLDSGGSHGLGNIFLKSIIDSFASYKFPVSQDFLEKPYCIHTEVCPEDDQTDRVDIVCDGQEFLLYIEVKIDSFEHGEQTKRYEKKLSQNSFGRKHAIIFLAPEAIATNKNAYNLTWKKCSEICDTIAGNASVSPLMSAILKQYSNFIRSF